MSLFEHVNLLLYTRYDINKFFMTNKRIKKVFRELNFQDNLYMEYMYDVNKIE